MRDLPKNIILKELDNVPDDLLADILNYIQFLRSVHNDDLQKEVDNNQQSNAYPTVNLNKPDYIIVNNHLN